MVEMNPAHWPEASMVFTKETDGRSQLRATTPYATFENPKYPNPQRCKDDPVPAA
jgi:hypothetical protein